jgi:hypothetical protein
MFQDPYEGQKQNQKLLDEIQTEFQRLHYELFLVNSEGKKLYTMLHNKFVTPSHFSPEHPHAGTLAIWWDGFRTAIRGLHEQAKQHELRIKIGGKR